MKKFFSRLAVLLCVLAGLGFLFSACAVHGSGGAFDDDSGNNGGAGTGTGGNSGAGSGTGGGSAGDGDSSLTGDAKIIQDYPNQYMYRYNGKTDDQFSDAEPYSITDFGAPATTEAADGVFRYYPTAIDLESDTAEFSAVVNGNNISGKQGIGLIQIEDGKVVGWVLATTAQKIRYLNPNNKVATNKTSESSSGWDSTTLQEDKFTANTDYTVKIVLVDAVETTGDDNGKKGFAVTVTDGEGTVVASKQIQYGAWVTPDANSKIYFAIGEAGNTNKTSYTTWSNVKVKINAGGTEGTEYAIKKVIDVQDQSSMTISQSSATLGIKGTAGDEKEFTYSAKDKDGAAVTPKVENEDGTVASATLGTNSDGNSVLKVKALKVGKTTITLTNESGTGKPTATLAVEVIQKGTVKLNGTEVADLAAAFAGLDATNGGSITLSADTHIVETGTQLKYTGSGEVTIKGEGTEAYGADVVIIGNPNTASQGSRELVYFTGASKIRIENLTIKNTYTTADDCQAEALATNGSSHLIAYNSTFDSHQDTIRTTGKAWFYKCHIKGDVDFLWMEASGVVALYENCKLTMVGDRKEAAYIAAPRTTYSDNGTIGKGLVVLNSEIYIEQELVEKQTEKSTENGAFLFRSPWYKADKTAKTAGIYNNASFIGTTVKEGSLNPLLVRADKLGFGIGDSSVVGFKTDGKNGLTATNVGTISAEDITAEYSNRGYILNRLIKIDSDAGTTTYKTDSDIWDVSSCDFAENTKNPEPEAFDEKKATITWTFADIAPESDGTTLKGGKNSFAGTINGYTGDKTVSLDVRFGLTSWYSSTKMKAWDANNERAESYNTILTVPVTPGASLEIPNKNGAAGFFYNNGTATEQLAVGATLSWKNSGNSTVNVVVWTTTAKSYLSTVTLTDYDLTQTVDTTSAASFIAIITNADSIAANASTAVKTYVIGSYGFDSTSANPTVTGTGAGATLTDGKLSGDGSTTGTATITATYSSISDTKAVEITEALSWDKAEWYITKDGGTTAASGVGSLASDFAGKNLQVFTFNSYSGIALGTTKTITPLDGSETKTVNTGLKMDKNGKFTFTVDKAATLTVNVGYFETTKTDENNTTTTKYSKLLKITASEGAAATADNSNPTTDLSADATYKWTLTEGTYTVERNSGDTAAPYYVKVEKNSN